MLEGHGLEPDIEVIDDPGIMARGVDPQLERAIEEVVRLLETAPPSMVEPPPYGDRTAGGNAP
jgi:tricorn protease